MMAEKPDLKKQYKEVYMGDPRRAEAEKLKTILRHPVQKKEM